ncbi:MAG: hypothetical protein HY299_14300 [Verrucomicrobia bacterium]|nr:hypothetical protein [Verrucomicrobiota bacterium]
MRIFPRIKTHRSAGLAMTEYLVLVALLAVGFVLASGRISAGVKYLAAQCVATLEQKSSDAAAPGLDDFASDPGGGLGESHTTPTTNPTPTKNTAKDFIDSLAGVSDWKERRSQLIDRALQQTKGDYSAAINVIKSWRESDPSLQNNPDLINAGHYVNASAQILNGVMIDIVQAESITYNILKLTGIWQLAQAIPNASAYIGEKLGHALGGKGPGSGYVAIASYPTEESFLSEQAGILNGLMILQERQRNQKH